jgi:tol-pal system protein YbgF
MTLLRRALVLAGIITLTASTAGITLFTLSGCRTSEQSRRGIAASRAVPNSQLDRQIDSLRMIQAKLVEVIDSMTSLAETDQDRIKALEADVAMLRSRIEGTALPEPPPDARSERGLTAPPPPRSRPQNFELPTQTPPAERPAESAPRSVDVTERYNAALRLFQQNNFDAALDAFQKLEQDDPRGTFAGNYKYWEGECYYAQKQYDKALKQFRGVQSDYPRSPKAAASEFKIGECYERLDRPSAARAAYERLIADYPTSEFRARALARIRALPSEQ